MAVDGNILDHYKNKKVKIYLRNEEGRLEGTLIKNNKKFFLMDSKQKIKLIISKIATIKEVEE